MASIDVNAIVTQLMEVERQPLKKFDVKNIGKVKMYIVLNEKNLL